MWAWWEPGVLSQSVDPPPDSESSWHLTFGLNSLYSLGISCNCRILQRSEYWNIASFHIIILFYHIYFLLGCRFTIDVILKMYGSWHSIIWGVFVFCWQAIENFAVTVKTTAQMLQKFGTDLSETELPNDVQYTKDLLTAHTEKHDKLKVRHCFSINTGLLNLATY